VPEDLALHQIARNGGAVQRHEGGIATIALAMDGLGADLLAGAALAGDEHRRSARRGAVDDAIDGLHRQRRTDKTLIVVALKVVLDAVDQIAHAQLVDRVAQRDDQTLLVERLLDEVEGTVAHGVDRLIHRAMAGDDDHRHGHAVLVHVVRRMSMPSMSGNCRSSSIACGGSRLMRAMALAPSGTCATSKGSSRR
jgi:hypothetical protein